MPLRYVSSVCCLNYNLIQLQQTCTYWKLLYTHLKYLSYNILSISHLAGNHLITCNFTWSRWYICSVLRIYYINSRAHLIPTLATPYFSDVDFSGRYYSSADLMYADFMRVCEIHAYVTLWHLILLPFREYLRFQGKFIMLNTYATSR